MKTVVKIILLLLFLVTTSFALNGKLVASDSPLRDILPMVTIDYLYWDPKKQESERTATPCSGIILNNQYVLTAMHCLLKRIYKPQTKQSFRLTINNIDIVYPSMRGSAVHDLSFSNRLFVTPNSMYDYGIDYIGNDRPEYGLLSHEFEPSNHSINVASDVGQIFFAPKINGYYPDLAILKLNTALQFSPVVTKISHHYDPTDGPTRVYGWGVGPQSGSLQEAVVKPIQSPHNEYIVGDEILHDGDSGGPTLQKISYGVYKLVGISSYTIKNTGYIVQTAKYADWINAVINGQYSNSASCQLKHNCYLD